MFVINVNRGICASRRLMRDQRRMATMIVKSNPLLAVITALALVPRSVSADTIRFLSF